jgi:phosphoribosylglycinamide formyltransferase-1
MLRVAVCVSGGGTNLQAIIDKVNDGTITNTELVLVVSNKPGAYALTRAKVAGIDTAVIEPKAYGSREAGEDVKPFSALIFKLELVSISPNK